MALFFSSPVSFCAMRREARKESVSLCFPVWPLGHLVPNCFDKEKKKRGIYLHACMAFGSTRVETDNEVDSKG